MIQKPSDKEQEYFLRQEAERLKQLREEHRKKVAEEERARLKELHYLHCPKCGQMMTTTTLHEVEVEVCPGCRGMFLDDGELEKLTEERARGRFASALASLRGLWGE
jgi:acetyl-CoA carboxylase beta subunit